MGRGPRSDSSLSGAARGNSAGSRSRRKKRYDSVSVHLGRRHTEVIYPLSRCYILPDAGWAPPGECLVLFLLIFRGESSLLIPVRTSVGVCRSPGPGFLIACLRSWWSGGFPSPNTLWGCMCYVPGPIPRSPVVCFIGTGPLRPEMVIMDHSRHVCVLLCDPVHLFAHDSSSRNHITIF